MVAVTNAGAPSIVGPAGRRRWARRLAALAMVLALAWCLAALVLDRRGRIDAPPPGPWQAIVVLGCGLDDDGQPSWALRARVHAAAQLWAAGVAPRLVTTGGVGRGGVSEADAAASLARSLGVPDEAITIERTSTSTEENASRAAAIVDVDDVVIVSDAYHVTRARLVFLRHFERVAAVGTVNPHAATRTWGALREVAALVAYAVTGRL
jgi:uncharacterized SAM-binding protein YcdF (DUF218 family)